MRIIPLLPHAGSLQHGERLFWAFHIYVGEGLGLLKPLARELPKGLHMVICGGFSNIIFVVYYLMTLMVARVSFFNSIK